MNYDKFSSSHRYFLAFVTAKTKPIQYSDVVSNPKWLTAMKQEIATLESNGTWTFTSLPVVSGFIG